ncbi:hypothetical protein AVEN_87274-1 [Araneus ventricosus]|uniref:Uncharacterized protein n=1 Tax=Araneus ventricosus TaxID=182803 RepID=A0A4Y2ECX0_ARAVE|nr:hypothetical protein AVEN_87274-1 [Araneus ventricosus]
MNLNLVREQLQISHDNLSDTFPFDSHLCSFSDRCSGTSLKNLECSLNLFRRFDAQRSSHIAKYVVANTTCSLELLNQTIDFRHTRTCCLKLKLSRKLSVSHNWAVVVRTMKMRSETLYLDIFTEK